jgi:hypothetical protein
MRKEQLAWSLISPTPQCFFHIPSNSYIVYWQGVAMSKAQAMIIVQQQWLETYATPSMKEAAFFHFKTAYLLGAFGNVDWNYSLMHFDGRQHITKLQQWLIKHDKNLFAKLTASYDIKTAMSWFTEDYQQILEN